MDDDPSVQGGHMETKECLHIDWQHGGVGTLLKDQCKANRLQRKGETNRKHSYPEMKTRHSKSKLYFQKFHSRWRCMTQPSQKKV